MDKTGDSLASYTFLAPDVSLTIDAGDGDDTIIRDGLDDRLKGKVVISGGAGSDTVAGPPENTDWYITGENAGDVAGVSFVEVENLSGSADNEDTFFVSATGSLAGVMDGGAGGFDSLVFTGGAFESVNYIAFDAHSGTVERDGDVLTYAGLEPITDNMVVADRVISTGGTLPASSDEAGLLGDDVDDRAELVANGDGTHTLASVSVVPTFESITFANPTNSLTINLAGDLDIPFLSKDVLEIVSFNAAGVDLIVNGEDGKDEVIVTGTVTAGDVTINAEIITVSGTINAANVILNADDEDDGAVVPDDGSAPAFLEVFKGLFIALPEARIDLTGGTIIATGVDDIFLLRAAAFLPNETADRPGYVALLHGNLAEYQDVVQNNEDFDEVQRINYDTGLNGRLTIEGQGGNDAFFADDTTVIVTLDGGAGDDLFQIGQIFGEKRIIPDGNLLAQDVFPSLVATTRGWLSPGLSAPLVARAAPATTTTRSSGP